MATEAATEPSGTRSSSSSRSNIVDNHDFIELRHLIRCDNPWCRAVRPPKSCNRCKIAHYCGIECQRAHWKRGGHKQSCFSCDDRRAQYERFTTFPTTTLTTKEMEASDNAGAWSPCGLCSKETTFPQRVVLSKCRHVFCFECLSNFQKRPVPPPPEVLKYIGTPISTTTSPPPLEPSSTPSLPSSTSASSPPSSSPATSTTADPKSCCPTCAAKLDFPVVMEALSRANLYANQATRLLDTEVEERFEVCRLANVELDKILLVEPQHHEALARKATFLTLTNQPAEALQVLDQLFELDRVEVKRQAELDAKLEEFYAAAQVARDNVGNAVLLDRAIDMMLAIARHYTDVDPPWPALIGAQYGDKKSPLRLLLLQLTVAETHEAAGDYAVARGEYEKMQAVIRSSRDRERPSNVEGTNVLDMESTCILMVLRGLSRSYYHLGEYEKAIEVVADKVRHRDVNGFHKLVALPLLALAEQNGFSIPTVVHGFSATLDGAIEVMYRGFVYEYQSDDSNTRANRALLQELCDKKAAMSSAAETE